MTVVQVMSGCYKSDVVINLTIIMKAVNCQDRDNWTWTWRLLDIDYD